MTSPRRRNDLKIVALDHSAELGGAELSLLHLAREFGEELQVVLLESGPLADRLTQEGHAPLIFELNPLFDNQLREGVPAPSSLPRIARTVRTLRRRLSRLLDDDATVLLVNSLRGAVMVALANLPRSILCVVMLHDALAAPHFARGHAILAQLAVHHAATAVVANSGWTLTHLRTSRPSFVVPPFMTRRVFDTPVVTRPWGVAGRSILLLGRIARWKGQLLGLEAVSRLPPGAVSSLTLAGAPWLKEGSYFREVQRQASKARDVGVTLAGHVSDVTGLIDAHDVVLHTSVRPEPFGQVVVEGMARARLVVAAGQGAPGEMIRDGDDGFLYRAGDVESLASVLGRVLDCDAVTAKRIGLAARTTAARFHPSRGAADLRRILSSVP